MIGADRFVHKLMDARQAQHATQRYTRGYSDIDMWNFDVFLADLIVAGCTWFLSNAPHTQGPASMDRSQWLDELMVIRTAFASRDVFGGMVEPTDEAWALLKRHFGNFWD
jgi:hypothetical protein